MRVVPLLVVAALSLSCSEAPTASDQPSGSTLGLAKAATVEAANAAPASDVAQLRRLVAPYHTVAAASAGGWDTDITGCLALPGVGGMGHHYANLGYLNDGQIAWNQPELLVFAPSPNARDGLKLAAVEYIVFKAQMPTAPTLYGQTFHSNDAIAAWVLHVWIGERNPDGMFMDWNPTVSCD
jgi:hypothetical protein